MADRAAGFSVRVSGSRDGSATAFVRKHRFVVGSPVTFDEQDPQLSALEYVLGAFGADLVTGLLAAARARHLELDHAEALVRADLDDELAAVGVVGATGSPALARVQVKVYASSGADEAALRELWNQTLERSPLVRTLQPVVRLELVLEMSP
ncbi:MAG TPA: OsmC family protein [Polyangiaceae bacterium]